MVRAQLIQFTSETKNSSESTDDPTGNTDTTGTAKTDNTDNTKTIIQTAQMILNHKLIKKRIRRVMEQIVLIAAKQQILLITD